MSRRTFRIGCAGWTLPGAHAAAFPRDGSHLQRYSAVFTAVEINSSFYRAHRRETYERWARSVPAAFRFSVKLPKQITHTLRLRRSAKLLDEFVEQTAGLGRRLGAVLVQLPPSLAFERAVARRFFMNLRDRSDGCVVVEPRHPTWFDERAESLLGEFSIGRVAADPSLNAAAAHPGGDSRLAYFRLHGSPRMYYSSYDDSFLESLAQRMRSVRGAREVWCVFDNTAHSHAVPNALRLAKLLKLAPAQRRPHSECMATGWAGDNAVNDQIDATVKDAIQRVRARAPKGPSLTHCEECEAKIPDARRKAVPGVRLCVACQTEHDKEDAAFSGYNRRGSKDSQLR